MTIKRFEQLDSGGSMSNYRSVAPGFTESLYSRVATLKRLIGKQPPPDMIVKVVSDDELAVAYPTISEEEKQVFGNSEPIQLVKEQINEYEVKGPQTLSGERVRYRWQPTERTLSVEQEQALQIGLEDGTFTESDIVKIRDTMVYHNQKDHSLM